MFSTCCSLQVVWNQSRRAHLCSREADTMLKEAIPLPGGVKELLKQDPWQFLKPTEKMLIEQSNIPFDAKTQCWVPDEKDGFIAGEKVGTEGEKITVIVKGEVRLALSYQW